MLHEDCQVLTKQGWARIHQGELAFIEEGRLVWREATLSKRYRGSFFEVSGRFFSLCVDAFTPINVLLYSQCAHQSYKPIWVDATQLTSDYVVMNNFNTTMIARSNPYLCSMNRYLKTEDAQFRLIPDVTRFNRFSELVRCFGRDYVEDLRGREMQGVVEFANYSPLTLDTIMLSALGDGRRPERLTPRRLRVIPNRFHLRVETYQRFHGGGYCLSGGEQIIVRHQGKIAIVGTDRL